MKKLMVITFLLLTLPAAAQTSKGKKRVLKKSVTLSSWTVAGRLWQERTYLVDNTGRSFALTDDFYGINLGYQRSTYRHGVSFRHEIYGFFGQVNVASAENSFTYFEKGLISVGGGLSETIFWTSAKRTIEYGLTLDAFYRRAIFPEPTATTTLDNVDRVLFILGPQVRWNLFGRTFFEQRIGYSPQAEDVIWNFGLAYRGSLW